MLTEGLFVDFRIRLICTLRLVTTPGTVGVPESRSPGVPGSHGVHLVLVVPVRPGSLHGHFSTRPAEQPTVGTFETLLQFFAT